MSKLARQMKENHRTGQAPGLMVPGGVGMSTVPGGVGMSTRSGNGGCGPLPPATPMSWGAACPSGSCTSDGLAASLNRQFAGDRYGCRELAYWLSGTADAAGVVTLAQNSMITICPTRIVFVEAAGAGIGALAMLSVFEIQNQNQIVGAPLPLAMISIGAYQTIPFVTDCLKAGIPFRIVMTGLVNTRVYTIGLIGPAIG